MLEDQLESHRTEIKNAKDPLHYCRGSMMTTATYSRSMDGYGRN